MTEPAVDIATPLARYAPYRRAGDLVFFAGVVPADPVAGKVVTGFADLPDAVRAELGETGEAAGGTLDDVVNLVQYFTDLSEFPLYNRVRTTFFPNPPASTCVQVVELLPTAETRLEVQAVAHIPER
jgi:enamine deaminase RidA (YjgF/YER057c/UK114 family)